MPTPHTPSPAGEGKPRNQKPLSRRSGRGVGVRELAKQLAIGIEILGQRLGWLASQALNVVGHKIQRT